MKQLILSFSLVTILLSCKKTDSTPTNPTTNKDTIQTSIAKYGAGVTDIDGNKYKSVIIGTQEWMGENLKVSKYHDGVVIPNVINNLDWSKLTSGAWCNYNNSDSLGVIYGKLYNWYVVNTQKVCPVGWHVPTKDEAVKLFVYLKADTVKDSTTKSLIFNKIGLKIKEKGISHWESYNNSNNSSLLTILPNGMRVDAGYYSSNGSTAYLWTSSESSLWSSYFFGTSNKSSLYEDMIVFDRYVKGLGGFAIRCIKN